MNSKLVEAAEAAAGALDNCSETAPSLKPILKFLKQEIKNAKKFQGQAVDLLQDVADDFESTGCEGCGTVSVKVINRVRKFVGYGKLGG